VPRSGQIAFAWGCLTDSTEPPAALGRGRDLAQEPREGCERKDGYLKADVRVADLVTPYGRDRNPGGHLVSEPTASHAARVTWVVEGSLIKIVLGNCRKRCAC
jgi:hypothetical protein